VTRSNRRCQQHRRNDTGDKFIAGVVDTGEQLIAGSLIREYLPRIFEKIRNGPKGVLMGPGDTDSWKKNWSRKSHVRLPLRCIHPNYFFIVSNVSVEFVLIYRPHPVSLVWYIEKY
jgi:hypothetical protein